MDDLISRQAAIYAIEKRMDDITCEEFAEGMSEAITEISLLPSAEAEPRWIPVAKRPIEKGLTLVTYNDGDVDLLKQPTAYRRSDIVAWMPIEPWRGEEHDEVGG